MDIKDLHQNQQRILNLLAQPGNEALTQGSIADMTELSKSNVNYHIGQLVDKSQVTKKPCPRNKRKKLYEITEDGIQTVRKLSLGRNSSNNNTSSYPEREEKDSDHLDISLHNVSIAFKIKNEKTLPDQWKEKLIQKSDLEFSREETNDSLYTYRKDRKIRITGKKVIVRLEKMSGEDAAQLKNEAMVKAYEMRDWVQQQIPPLNLKNAPVEFSAYTARQHIAIMRDPLHQLVDDFSSLDPSDVKIYDDQGTERVWLDSSEDEEGNSEDHLEAGNSPGENRVYAEDDISQIKDIYRAYIQENFNPEDVKKLKELSDFDAQESMDSLEMGQQLLLLKILQDFQDDEDPAEDPDHVNVHKNCIEKVEKDAGGYLFYCEECDSYAHPRDVKRVEI